MKRRIALLLMLLIAGTMVNVAVAWACAAWSPQDRWTSDRPINVPAAWPRYLAALGWPPPDSATAREGVGPGVTIVEVSGGDPDADWRPSGFGSDKTSVSLEVRGFGIPFRCLQWELHGIRAGSRAKTMADAAARAAGTRTGFDISGLTGATRTGAIRRLPVMPLWAGFLMNTLFYILMTVLLFGAPGTLRRLIRRRRGQCQACGYPIGASPVCTECGAAVSVA